MKLSYIVFAALTFCAPGGFALNVGFLPGDAVFGTSLSKQEWMEKLEEPSGKVELEYWFGGFQRCGKAGQSTLVFDRLPTDVRDFIETVIKDQKMWELDPKAPIMSGPLFCFCANDFDLMKHSVGEMYNLKRDEELAIYPAGKAYIQKRPSAFKKLRKASASKDRPSKFGAVLPFDPKTAILDDGYDETLRPPKEFSVIAISMTYTDDLDWESGRALQLRDGRVSAFEYAKGEWRRLEVSSGSEQGARQPATAPKSKSEVKEKPKPESKRRSQ